MNKLRVFRLSPYSRGEDEGEGFEQIRTGSTLTLPLSLRKGEATLHLLRYATIWLPT